MMTFVSPLWLAPVFALFLVGCVAQPGELPTRYYRLRPEHFPRYQSPWSRTSTNHYALWASIVYLAGRVFGNREWEKLGAA